MKITQIIGLGLVNGQYYDYSPDLSAILAAYDVSYDASSQDYNFADNYTPEISGSDDYDQAGPAEVPFGDYAASSFTDEYDVDAPVVTQDELTDERLRPNKGLAAEIEALVASGEITGKTNNIVGAGLFNGCPVCTGQSAAECVASGTYEDCGETAMVQPVCEVRVTVERKGADPIYRSGCKEKVACYNNEKQNFVAGIKYQNQCRSSLMAARFAKSTCTFCTKMGDGSSFGALFHKDDTTGFVVGKILSENKNAAIDIDDALLVPEQYFAKGGANYIYDKQTWYTDSM